MNPERGADSPSPAVEQLLRHLGALREDRPEPDTGLVAIIVTRARWQAAMRPFAEAAGRLLGGLGDSLRILAGGR